LIIAWVNSPTQSRNPLFDRVEPNVEKINLRRRFPTAGRASLCYCGHGMVSTGGRKPALGFQSPGDYATFNSNQTPDKKARRRRDVPVDVENMRWTLPALSR
jgi:hypothetical protein